MTTVLAPPAPAAAPPFASTEASGRPRVGRVDVRGARGVRAAGFVVIGLQVAALLAWSTVLADRFALTKDFASYYQAAWLVAHGHLDPFDSIKGTPFFVDHGELLVWPLSALVALWPHPVTLAWIQCLGMGGAELAAFEWLCDLVAPAPGRVAWAGTAAGRGLGGRWPAVLIGTGAVLLVADPWVWWAVSFAIHEELLGVAFLVLAARELARQPSRRRVWLWVALALASGDVVSTYLVAVAAGVGLASRPSRRRALVVAGAAVAWCLVLTALHADRGSNLSNYAYLAAGAGASPAGIGMTDVLSGIVRHPQRVLEMLWDRRLDVYAKLSAGGLLGVLSPWVGLAVLLVVVENAGDANGQFVAPGFQDALLYVLVPVGTVHVLWVLARRRPRLAAALTAALVANAIGWGVVWIPDTASRWLHVSPQAASVLSSVERRIGPGQEVVASQGVVGPFAGRRWIYPFTGSSPVPVHGRVVWVVVTPRQGIETATVAESDELIAELAGPLHARLVTGSAGVWAFRWEPRPGVHSLATSTAPQTLPAWASAGAAGRPLTEGPTSDWRTVADGARGYVVDGDYWPEPPATYRATVVLSSTVPVDVEVWNATGDALLARRRVPPTDGFQAVTLAVTAVHAYPVTTYDGAGPFSVLPLLPSTDDRLEIRVWSPGRGVVSVASLELAAVHAAG